MMCLGGEVGSLDGKPVLLVCDRENSKLQTGKCVHVQERRFGVVGWMELRKEIARWEIQQ
jgi:hypothetical protein